MSHADERRRQPCRDRRSDSRSARYSRRAHLTVARHRPAEVVRLVPTSQDPLSHPTSRRSRPSSSTSTPAFSLSISTSPTADSGGLSTEASPRSALSNGSMDDLFSKFDDILAAELDDDSHSAPGGQQAAAEGGGVQQQQQGRQDSQDFDIGDVVASSDYQHMWQEQKGREDDQQQRQQAQQYSVLPVPADEPAQPVSDDSSMPSFDDFPVDRSIVSDPFPSSDLDAAFDSILAANTSLDASYSATPTTAPQPAIPSSTTIRSPPSATPPSVTPPQAASPYAVAAGRLRPQSAASSAQIPPSARPYQSTTPPTLQLQQPTIVSPIIAATPDAQPPSFSSAAVDPVLASVQPLSAAVSIDSAAELQAAVSERDGQLAALQTDLNTWVERYGQIYTEYERLSAHVATLTAEQQQAAAQAASATADTANVTELYQRVVSLTTELDDERTARQRERNDLRQRQHSLIEALDTERNEHKQHVERIQTEAQQRAAEAEARAAQAEAESRRLVGVVAEGREAVERERLEVRQREEDEIRRVVEDRERVLGEREELVQRVEALTHQLTVSVRRDDYDALDALRGKEREELIAHYNSVLEQQAEQIDSLTTLAAQQPPSRPNDEELTQLRQRVAELEEDQTRAAADKADEESNRREAELRASQFEAIINQQTAELESLRASQQAIPQLHSTIQQLQAQLTAATAAAPAPGSSSSSSGSASEKALREELEEVSWKMSALEEERDSWAEERQEMEDRIRAMQSEVKQVKAASNHSSPRTVSPTNREKKEREDREQLLVARETELTAVKTQLGELQGKLELWESNVDELQSELEHVEQQRREMRADFDSREQQLRDQLNAAQQQLMQISLTPPTAAAPVLPPHSEDGWPSFDDSNGQQTELVAELEAKVAALEDELRQARTAADQEADEWRKQLEELRATVQRRDEQHSAELMASEAQVQASQQHYSALRAQLQQLSEAMRLEKAEADTLKQSLREVAAELAGARENNRVLEQDVESRIADLNTQVSDKEEQLADLMHQQEERDEDRRREREDLLALMSKERQQLTEQLEAEREERRTERADMENVAEERARLQDEREQLVLTAQSTQQQLETLQYQYAQLQADMQQREAQVSNMQSQWTASMEEREARLSQQISALSLERDQLTQHYHTLSAERDQLAHQLANAHANQQSTDAISDDERAHWKREVDVRDEKLKKLVKVARELKAAAEALNREKAAKDDEVRSRDDELREMAERLVELQREKEGLEREREDREQADRERLAGDMERDEQEAERLRQHQLQIEQLTAQVQQLQYQQQQSSTTQQQQIEEQLTRLQQQHQAELQEREARLSQLSTQVAQLLDAEADLRRVLLESQDESEEAQRSLLLKEDELNEQKERFHSEQKALQQQLAEAIAVRQQMEQAQQGVSAALQQVQQLQSELLQQRGALNAANQHSNAAEQALAAERHTLADIRLQHEQQLAELLREKEAAQAQAQQLVATHTSEVQALQAELEALRAAQQQQASEKEQEASRIDELMNQMSDKEDQLFELQARVEELQTQLDTTVEASRTEREAAEQQLGDEQRKRAEAEVEDERRRDEAGERMLQLQTTVDELSRQLAEERSREQERSRKQAEDDAQRALAVANTAALDLAPPPSAEAEAKVSELEAQLARVKDELARGEGRLSEMLEQLGSAEEQVDILRRENEELSDALETERAATAEREEEESRERAVRTEQEAAQRSTYVAEMQQLREHIAARAEQQAADKQQLAELREAEARRMAVEAQLAEVEVKCQTAEAELREAQHQAAAAESEVRQLRDTMTAREQQIELLRQEPGDTATSETELALQASMAALQARVQELEEEKEVSQRHAQSYHDEVEALKQQTHELNGRLMRAEEEQKREVERQHHAADKQTEEKLPTPSPPAAAATAASVEDEEADGWNDDGWDNELSMDDDAPAALDTSALASVPAAAAQPAPAATANQLSADRDKLELLEARVTELEEEAETAREDAIKVYEQLKEAEAELAKLRTNERTAARAAAFGGASSDGEVEELRHRLSEMEEEMRSLLVSGDEDKEALETEVTTLKAAHTTALATLANLTHSSDSDLVGQVKAIADKVADMERAEDELQAGRRKDEEDEREALRGQVREWREKYDGVLRVQEALQQDGEETERENRKLAQEIFELKEKIGQIEEEREQEHAALQQLREQQQQHQASGQPAAAAERVEEQTQTEPSSPTDHHQTVAPVASVESAAIPSDVTVPEAEPSSDVSSASVDDAVAASTSDLSAVEQVPEANAAPAATPVYTDEYVRSLYEQSMNDREQLIAYYTGFLTQRDTELQQLREQLAAAEARMPTAPPKLQPSDTHFDTVVSSAERDTAHLSSTDVEQQDIVEPATEPSVAESDEHKSERKESEDSATEPTDPLVSPGMPPAFLDDMPSGSPPSASFSLNADGVQQTMDGDALSFTLQPVTPLSPLSTPLSPASHHSAASQPSQSLPESASAPPASDDSSAVASTAPMSSDADAGAEAGGAVISADAVAQWQAAVAERDAQLAAMYGDLNTWVERYGAIYAEYERLTAQVAALTALQQSEQLAPAAPTAVHADNAAAHTDAAAAPEAPSRAASDTPAALHEAAADDASLLQRTAVPAAALSPGPDYAAELEHQRQRLYEVEHERSRLREENDDLRYRMVELKDKQAELEQHNQQLVQQQQQQPQQPQSSSPPEDSSSSHLLHLTLVQQEMQAVQVALDERDRFITLTLARIAAYQKDREELKRKEEQRKLKEKEQAPKQSGGFKLFGGGGKKQPTELRPEDDDTMEWNGREWVKKPEDDAVSALLPLPAKPKPLPPSALPGDLASLSVDDVMKRMGLKAASGSPIVPGVFSVRSPPSASLMPGRPSNAYGAAKAKPVSARYASSFDDFGFEGDSKGVQPAMSPGMSAVLSPLPPDAVDLNTQVFMPAMPAPAHTPMMPATASTSPDSSTTDDARLLGRSVAQLLDALDAATASIQALEQQLAITSSLPRPIPSPSPDQPAVDGMDMAHLRGQLRLKEEEKISLELALTQEREHVASLSHRIAAMRQAEAQLLDGRDEDEHEEPALEAGGDEAAMDALQLLARVRALRHKFDRVSRQLHMARQRVRELEVDKERHSHGSVEEQEERAKREAALASTQREYEGVVKERDGLRAERDHLLYQLQQAIAARTQHAGGAGSSTQPSPDTAMVRRSSAAGSSDDADELQRLRAMVSDLQRHIRSERAEADSAPAAASGAGSVLTASVRINRFFLVSFVLMLLAVLAMQLAKPEWLGGLDLVRDSGGAGGDGGVWDASREL